MARCGFAHYDASMAARGETGTTPNVVRVDSEHAGQRLDNFLDTAEVDSWEVKALRPVWRRCRAQMATLRDALERWQQDFKDVQVLDLANLAPNLPAFGAEIEMRLTEIERMFAGDPPTRSPSRVQLESDEHVRNTLAHFDRAALSVSRERLSLIEAVTRDLFATVSVIKGFERREAATSFHRTEAPLSLDRDQLSQALRVAASAWLGFLVIIYLPDVPGELATLGIITRIVVADTKFAWIPVQSLIRPTFTAILVAFPFYVLVMPTLSSFAGLAVLLFAFVFVVDYAFHAPKQALWRVLFLFLFLTLADIKNSQAYSFQHFANTAVQWTLLFFLLSLTEYVPVSQQPQIVCLRMIGRFFRSCEFLMATLSWSTRHQPSRLARWRKTFHAHEVAALPGKIATWGRFVPSAALGGTMPDQVRQLAMSLQALSYRMQELTEAATFQQSESLVRELLIDVRRWRVAVQEIFTQLAEKAKAVESASLQARLDAVLLRLEARVQEALAKVGDGVSAEESDNMYRLLGAHRGVSEALVDFASKSVGVDWNRLREQSF